MRSLSPTMLTLYLLVDRFEELRYIHFPRVENQFADALATLASIIEIHAEVTVRPLLIETRFAPAYYFLIGDIEDQDELPWYHDIYQFLSCVAYLEPTLARDKRVLRHLLARFVVCGNALYRRSRWHVVIMSRQCLYRSSDERGLCRSLWPTHGRSYANA